MIRIWDRQREPGKVWLTTVFIIVNLLSFWVTRGEDYSPYGGLIPAQWFYPEALGNLSQERPPVMVTVFWSMFLHANLVHLLGNILFLYLFGPNLEARLGRLRFALFFFSCGAAGALTHVGFYPKSIIPVIGASGAISGLLGGYWVWYGHHFFRIRFGTMRTGIRDFSIPVKILLVIWLLLQVLNTLLPDPLETIRVAYMTHLGGFACGYLLARSTGWRRRRKFKVFEGGSQSSQWND